jgi:hypothetical protein
MGQNVHLARARVIKLTSYFVFILAEATGGTDGGKALRFFHIKDNLNQNVSSKPAFGFIEFVTHGSRLVTCYNVSVPYNVISPRYLGTKVEN